MNKEEAKTAYERFDGMVKYDHFTSEQLFIENTYKQYKGYIYSIINRALINKQEKEEIFQEVFVVAVSNYNKIKSYENIKSWLSITARNLINNANRKYSKQLRQIDYNFDRWYEQVANVDIFEEMRYQEYLKLGVFEWVIGMLTENERCLYQLKYVHDKNLEEIAIYFGISKKCASTRLWRLKQKIEQSVKKFGVEHRI